MLNVGKIEEGFVLDHIKAGNPIDACYSIVENFYRGSSTIQLRLKDIRERDELI